MLFSNSSPARIKRFIFIACIFALLCASVALGARALRAKPDNSTPNDVQPSPKPAIGEQATSNAPAADVSVTTDAIAATNRQTPQAAQATANKTAKERIPFWTCATLHG